MKKKIVFATMLVLMIISVCMVHLAANGDYGDYYNRDWIQEKNIEDSNNGHCDTNYQDDGWGYCAPEVAGEASVVQPGAEDSADRLTGAIENSVATCTDGNTYNAAEGLHTGDIKDYSLSVGGEQGKTLHDAGEAIVQPWCYRNDYSAADVVRENGVDWAAQFYEGGDSDWNSLSQSEKTQFALEMAQSHNDRFVNGNNYPDAGDVAFYTKTTYDENGNPTVEYLDVNGNVIPKDQIPDGKFVCTEAWVADRLASLDPKARIQFLEALTAATAGIEDLDRKTIEELIEEIENPDPDSNDGGHVWSSIATSTTDYDDFNPDIVSSISSDIYNVQVAIPTSENLIWTITAKKSLYHIQTRTRTPSAGVRGIQIVVTASYSYKVPERGHWETHGRR